MAEADNKGAYKRLPLCDERKMLAVVTLKGPNAGRLRGFIPPTQLAGATASVLHCNTALRALATITVGWLRIPRLG